MNHFRDLRESPYTQTIWADRDSTRRIVQRFVNKGWWFAHEVDHGVTTNGMVHRITFASTISLEKDIRKSLANLNFTVL